MAPEMLSGKGYGKAVDWWSFGSLIYEMLTGLPPFYHQDVQQMYRLILTARLSFPPFMSDHARSLVSLLLEKNPADRFTNPEFMKRHPFFEGIDWDLLYRKKITPPFVPAVSSAVDISQIDPIFTDEKPSLESGSSCTSSAPTTAADGASGASAASDPAAAAASSSAAVDPAAAAEGAFTQFSYVSPEHGGALPPSSQ